MKFRTGGKVRERIAEHAPTGWNSLTDSKVWMGEDNVGLIIDIFDPLFLEGDFFMSKLNSKASVSVRKLVIAAMFCALAFASMFVMRINVVFLTFDAKDAIVTIAGLILGPLYSIGISLTVALLELITVGDTGFWGFVMDFLSTAAFSFSCAVNYKYMKNMKGAAIGLAAAVFAMTGFMLLFNLFVLPLYNPAYSMSSVMAIIPSLLLPFNLTKGALNAAIVLVLYKPVSKALKAAKMLPGSNFSGQNAVSDTDRKKRNLALSLTVTAIGLLIAIICIIIFFVFLDGSFTLVEKLK